MNGARALLSTLVDSGVDVCFANPGTSEMHFVAALDDVPAMRGVLCLFEGVVTGAADGYGRVAGRPAATLLHLGPGLGNGLAVFTLRQFFLGIPPSLAEAAHVDGASWPRIFWSVYLPLTRPAMIGAGLILFLFQWQAYLWPILVTSTDSLDLAPVAIAKSFGAFSTDYGRVFAETAVLAVIPAVVLLSLQRYFVTSVASSGSKE